MPGRHPLRTSVAALTTTRAAAALAVAATVAFGTGAGLGAQSRTSDRTTAPLAVPALGLRDRLAADLLPRFAPAAATADLTTPQHARGCTGNAAGAAWADVDGDGRLDLYLAEPDGPGQLWLGRDNSRFERAALAVHGIPRVRANAASFADIDNDGREDLYLAARGRDRLMRNTGHGRFTDITRRSGTNDPGPGTSVAWADVDRDGLLDVYVTDGDNCVGPTATPDHLYRNEGHGRFTDVSPVIRQATAAGDGIGLQATWIDVDGDGDQDLYLANDHLGLHVNALLRNDTSGHRRWRFTAIGRARGTDVPVSSMGVGVGDLDGDGREDLVVSDMDAAPLVLLARRDRWMIRRLPSPPGGPRPIAWGTVVADVDNDGHNDVLAAAGALGLDRVRQPDLLYLGDGAGRFVEQATASGLGDPGRGRAVAIADPDADGNLDVLVTRLGQTPLLYRNRGPRDPNRAHWLELSLRGTASTRDPCGARVVATTAARRTVHSLRCGPEGPGAAQHLIHLGLGRATRVRLRLLWPSGVTQALRVTGVDRVLRLVEPRRRRSAQRRPSRRAASTGRANAR